MLPLKLVRSLVLGDAINNPFPPAPTHQNQHENDNDDYNKPTTTTTTTTADHKNKTHKPKSKSKSKTPLLIFIPTKELVSDTYRLAKLARDIGMDLCPNPSLSHIIFSWPPPSSSSSSSSSPSSSSSYPSLSSCSSSWSLPNDAVPLPFPSLSSASLSHLRCFITLCKGFFKLVFLNSSLKQPIDNIGHQTSNWDCCSVSLVSKLTGDRIYSMDGFSRALAGLGWTLYKTKNNPSTDSSETQNRGANSVFLFRKLDSSRVRAQQPNGNGGSSSSGECRIRELRLPPLDFRNAPLRILQYILLMTDDIFYLA